MLDNVYDDEQHTMKELQEMDDFGDPDDCDPDD